MTEERGMGDEAPPEGGGAQAGDRHLEPDELGAFLDGTLRGAELSRLEAHLAHCAGCREEAIQVGRLTQTGNGNGKGRRRHAYWAAPAAAAAVAAVLLLGPGADDPGRQDDPVLRTDDGAASAITVLSPAPSSTRRGDPLVFTWNAIESDVVYKLTLMDDEGGVLWQETVEDTTLALPAEVEVVPGARYYWYVDALLELARTATSGVEEFTISP